MTTHFAKALCIQVNGREYIKGYTGYATGAKRVQFIKEVINKEFDKVTREQLEASLKDGLQRVGTCKNVTITEGEYMTSLETEQRTSYRGKDFIIAWS